MSDASAGSRSVAAALALALFAYAAAFLWAAAPSWFGYDDFAFLGRVQGVAPWSWLNVAAALEKPWWPFYRPLGMESYYFVGFRLFGTEALGFRVISLAVDLLTTLLVFRIATQLGFARLPAAFAAVLSLTSAPRTHILFEGYSFQYTSALFFTALTVSLFLDHLRRGSPALAVASGAALLCGLLCNEVALAAAAACGLLALHHERSLHAGAVLRSAARLVPQVAVAAAWLALRLAISARTGTPDAYAMTFGPHVAANAIVFLSDAIGAGPIGAGRLYVHTGANLWPLVAFAVLGATALGFCLRVPEARRRGRDWILPLNAVLLGWGLVSVLPFIGLVGHQARWGAPLTLPLALLVGSWIDGCWQASRGRSRRTLSLALVALAFAALPYGTLRERAHHPEGREARRFHDLIRSEMHRVPEVKHYFVLHGGSALAGREQVDRFVGLIYGGDFLRGVFAEPFRARTLRLRWLDVDEPHPPLPVRKPCVYIVFDRSEQFRRADAATAARLLPDAAMRCRIL